MRMWPMVRVFLNEGLTRRSVARRNEPALIMDDPQQVTEFALAGLEGGTVAPMYLFYSTQICELLRPGDRVLDLACGPANQLGQLAQLNADCQFVGIDLSSAMLARARDLTAAKRLANISFVRGSITDLNGFADHSFDVVMSTLSLHHLPDAAAFSQTFKEAARVLKPGGGMYFADFGRLKREDSMAYFAYQNKDRQGPVLTLDYINSLRAAFALEDFKTAWAQSLAGRARVFSTWCVPFLVVVKTPARRALPDALKKALHGLHAALSASDKAELVYLRAFFRAGGLTSPAL